TLTNEKVQSIIEHFVKDDGTDQSIITASNKLKDSKRKVNIQFDQYEGTDSTKNKRTGYYERALSTRRQRIESYVRDLPTGD
ncbi:transposase, partial [Enterococcus lactis]|uniref:transposase n=1 Tax=Enterococcus lactis TaxID=357441 RepID=UPI001C7D57EC